jgi:GTPase SAR1 family protein
MREKVIYRKVGVLLGHFNHGKTSLLERLLIETSSSLSPSSLSPTLMSLSPSPYEREKKNIKGKGKGKERENDNGQKVYRPFNLVASEKHGITQEVRTRAISLPSSLSISPSPSVSSNLGEIETEREIEREYEVTLIDTPGQDIFYRMRNLGAKVADFAILLIDVDDGVSHYLICIPLSVSC